MLPGIVSWRSAIVGDHDTNGTSWQEDKKRKKKFRNRNKTLQIHSKLQNAHKIKCCEKFLYTYYLAVMELVVAASALHHTIIYLCI